MKNVICLAIFAVSLLGCSQKYQIDNQSDGVSSPDTTSALTTRSVEALFIKKKLYDDLEVTCQRLGILQVGRLEACIKSMAKDELSKKLSQPSPASSNQAMPRQEIRAADERDIFISLLREIMSGQIDDIRSLEIPNGSDINITNRMNYLRTQKIQDIRLRELRLQEQKRQEASQKMLRVPSQPDLSK